MRRRPRRASGALLGASALAAASVSLRSLRWIFLLRRAEIRIPIRDAYIGYLSGFSLLFTPLLAGEIAVRALADRSRGNVPVHTTMVVNVWERVLDAAALSVLAAAGAYVAHGRVPTWSLVLLVGALLSFVTPLRALALRVVVAVCGPIAGVFDTSRQSDDHRLGDLRTWSTAFEPVSSRGRCPALVCGCWRVRPIADSTSPMRWRPTRCRRQRACGPSRQAACWSPDARCSTCSPRMGSLMRTRC
ncbi:MAG: lysylphosphatidylglycerol synthase domain-containing protein [Vicinamibacterales bacterium]